MDHGPAILIAGTHSGCGKTTVSLGIMAALRARGHDVQPFKCGPDFIDPTLHQAVTGRVSRNLDLRMCGEDFVRSCFNSYRSARPGISVIEGVMGLYDGEVGSAAHLARLLNLPVLLVVDVRSAAQSVAAVVHGFASLDPGVHLAGVVLNRVGSARHRQLIEEALGRYCDLPIVGFLPRNQELTIPSRHLGLHMGSEHRLALERLARFMDEHLDLDLLLELAKQTRSGHEGSRPEASPATSLQTDETVRIGVARDEAFCFYYQDNLDMLSDAGAQLVEFSPIHDAILPEGLDGLYLGGGYPELFARQLSANKTMRTAIKEFARSGCPVYAECGGFMYLTRSIVCLQHTMDQEGVEYPMAGVFPVTARMQARLRRLGYRQVVQKRAGFFGPAGRKLFGHEFHYSTIDPMPEHVERVYCLEDGRHEGYRIYNTLAGYLHLHWGQTPEAARNFVQACRDLAG
ncbi:cobyrinate a,c-diamide synthase [Desulfolithobacter sp.]